MNEKVRDSYDRIAGRYVDSRGQFDSLPYLERFADLLPAVGTVLDVGCGAGIPAARFLVNRGFAVQGIDISRRMIELARANVPGAAFEVRDMLSMRHGEFAVDGIVALYSVFHVKRDQHQQLISILRSFLKPGGALLLTMGAEDWEGSEPDFHGAEMFWSHFGRERNRAMLEAVGFRVLLDEIDTRGGERHQVLIGRAAAEENASGA